VLYRIVHLSVRILSRFLCRLVVTGREHIPERGPFLVALNHLSSVDPILLYAQMPVRLRMAGMAAMAHRYDWFIGRWMDYGGAVWVRRGEIDRRALREALDALAAGRPLGLAPEGTRSKTGALIEGKKGAAFLALRSEAPILPVVVYGTEKVLPNLRRLRRMTIPMIYAPAFSLPPRGDGPRSEHVQYCTDLIMARLASMLPEAYRGVYIGHPLIPYWEQLDASGRAAHPEWKREIVLDADGRGSLAQAGGARGTRIS
jgi:1-acyl-sn-glycerol-3-phosphate acyltransferase